MASPVAALGLVFVTSGYQRPSPIYAIELGARGDLPLPDGASESDAVL